MSDREVAALLYHVVAPDLRSRSGGEQRHDRNEKYVSCEYDKYPPENGGDVYREFRVLSGEIQYLL